MRPGIFAAVALAVAAFAAPASAVVPGYPVVSENFSVPEGTQVGADVHCPGGEDQAISGGTNNGVPITEQLWLMSSRPRDSVNFDIGSWTVQVANVTDGIPTEPPAEVWAVCDEGGQGDYAIREKSGVQVADGVQKTRLVKCQDDEAVVGGGGHLSNTQGAFLSSSAPLDTGDRDSRPDGWYVAAEVPADTSAILYPYVVCDQQRGPQKYRYPTDSDQAQDGEQGDVIPVCNFPLGEARVGGGVVSRAKFKHRLRISVTYPEGDSGWAAFVDNVDTPDNDARKITGTAICLKA